MPPVTLLVEHFRTMRYGLQLYSVRNNAPGQVSMAADFYTRMADLIARRSDLQEQWEKFVINLERLDQRQTSMLEIDWLRDEVKARALPSEARRLYAVGLKPPIDFRLYCFPAAPRTLILFNGDLKTHRDPNQCPRVGPHFRLACRLAHFLERLQDEWTIDTNQRLIPDPFDFDYY